MNKLFCLSRKVLRSKSFNEDQAGRKRDAQRLINCWELLYGKNSIDGKTFWNIVDGFKLTVLWLRTIAGAIRVWVSRTDLRIIERHVRTSEETAPFVNHAPYNYFDANCWELLSETATRKLRESRFRTIGFVITGENLARELLLGKLRYCTGCIRELRIRAVNVAHKGGFPRNARCKRYYAHCIYYIRQCTQFTSAPKHIAIQWTWLITYICIEYSKSYYDK